MPPPPGPPPPDPPGGGDDALPVPPPAPLPPVRGAAAPAEATVFVGSGEITYYRSKNSFEAVCSQHGCVLTRTARFKRVA
eukprot:8717576-Pyramimonas_sp.AAC.1